MRDPYVTIAIHMSRLRNQHTAFALLLNRGKITKLEGRFLSILTTLPLRKSSLNKPNLLNFYAYMVATMLQMMHASLLPMIH